MNLRIAMALPLLFLISTIFLENKLEPAHRLLTAGQLAPLAATEIPPEPQEVSKELDIRRCQEMPTRACVFSWALLAVLDHHPSQQPEILSEIGLTMARSGRAEETIGILKSLERGDVETLLTTANALHLGERYGRALKTGLDEEADYTKSSRMLNTIRAFGELGMIADAVAAALIIEDDFARQFALSELTGVLAKTGKMEIALRLAASIDGIAYKEGAYRNIVEALADMGKVDDALAIVALIEGNAPKAEALIHVGRAKGDPEMIQNGIDMMKFQVPPLLVDSAVRKGAVALAAIGHIDRSEANLSFMSDDYGTQDVLLRIAKIQVDAGMIAEAFVTAKGALYIGLEHELEIAVAEHHAKRGEDEVAFRVAQKIPNMDAQETALCGIARAQAYRGELASAIKTIRDISPTRRCKVETLGALAAMM